MKKNCLIAGPTNAGKTILARRLVDEHGFSRISGDAMVLAFQKTFPGLEIGHDVPGKTMEDAYQVTCAGFGRFVVEFVNALAWESPAPYVLDTFHVRPADLAGIDTRKATVLFLGYPEADPVRKAELAKRYQEEHHGGMHGWVAEDIDAVAKKFRVFIEMSRKLRDECVAAGITFIDTSEDLPAAIEDAARWALSGDKAYD